MFLHNVNHVLNQERDIIIHVILKENKTTKNKNKTCPQIIETIKSGTSQQHSP